MALTARDDSYNVESISPTSLSPVLKSNLTIQLPSSFPYTLNKEDFSVNATDRVNEGHYHYEPPEYTRYLNVIDVDDDAKTITAKFGGAWTGNYSIKIRHAEAGILDTDENSIILEVQAWMDSYSP